MGEFHIVWIIEDCHFAQAHISQQIYLPHYNDFVKSTMASQIISLTNVYSTVYSDEITENLKAPRHWHFCGEFTGDRWIPRTNGQ